MDDPASDNSSRSLDSSSNDDVDEQESRSDEQFDEDSYWRRAKRNKNGFQDTDLLSNLPENVMNGILTRLPLQMAVRTSILSKKWRYKWCKLPQLTLEPSLLELTDDQLTPSTKFRNIMNQILTLHSGPLTKFILKISQLKKYSMIGSLMYFLSRQDIQHLVLEFSEWNRYRLPPPFFSCLQLKHLRLQNCVVCPPPTFKGFDMLIRLELCNVRISTESLESLISHSQLLEKLVLDISDISDPIQINAPKLRSFNFRGCIKFISFHNAPLLAKLSLLDGESFDEMGKSEFDNFFLSLPALQRLYLESGSGQFFGNGADVVPRRLTSPLNNLKRLHVSLDNFVDLSRALCWIRSAPYLQDIEVEICNLRYYDMPYVPYGKVSAIFTDVTLDHLRTVKLTSVKGAAVELELIKLLLTKSPKLVKMLILLYKYMNRDHILARVGKIKWASREAVVVYEDPSDKYDFKLHREY